MKKILLPGPILFTFILFALPLIAAYTPDGHIGLLTVAETSNGTSLEKGGVADLYLSIKPGSGRIFIDSFPLSRLDTQITMRFAAETACDFLDIDCSNLDFFYTIRADSAMVGGPSAGAATTVLTTAMLDNQKINGDVIMTGTINSGNLIGPVAGINAKSLAAQSYGYKKVLIPKYDIYNQSDFLFIEVKQVSTLEDALYEFTGKNYTKTYPPMTIDPDYEALMKKVTIDLCSKYGGVKDGVIMMPNITNIIPDYYAINNNTNTTRRDFFGSAIDAINNGSYYTAASLCFAGNVRITSELLKNKSQTNLKTQYAHMLGDISVLEDQLKQRNANINTLSQLEAYMVVQERIVDAKDSMSTQNLNNISASDLAYAMERINTANVWSQFFNLKGKEFVKDNNALNTACNKKIDETEERINYLQLYFPSEIDRTDLNKAYDYSRNKDYALCIFTASKAKADVDVILSALAVDENNLDGLINDKISAAENSISEQEQHGIFPIIGYSYYEYSKSLKETDKYSSLLYAEYALELSNLDKYLPTKKSIVTPPRFTQETIYAFAAGFCAGVLILLIFILISYRNRMSNKKIRKRR